MEILQFKPRDRGSEVYDMYLVELNEKEQLIYMKGDNDESLEGDQAASENWS